MHWRNRTYMQWEGYIWGSFNTFILTQAGRRRATHFVKLVSSQVEKTEKWSGLAVKQLTSYCVPSPQQMEMRPVPHPGANCAPHCVTVCRITGTCMDYHRRHAAGWFPSDRRRHNVHTTGPSRMANTDNIHIMVQDFYCMQQRWQLCIKQDISFHSAWNKVTTSPLLSSSDWLLLRQSISYANIHRGLWSQIFFKELNFCPLEKTQNLQNPILIYFVRIEIFSFLYSPF